MNIVYEAMETIKMFDRARDARRVAKSIRTHEKTMAGLAPSGQKPTYSGVTGERTPTKLPSSVREVHPLYDQEKDK
jgi:hypothetical protein